MVAIISLRTLGKAVPSYEWIFLKKVGWSEWLSAEI